MNDKRENKRTNPYEPPHQVGDDHRHPRGFDCPQCKATLPFWGLWLLQPFGRCSNCRTRLVIRRPGLHKAWTPLLATAFCLSIALTMNLPGDIALLVLVAALLSCASIDGLIAYRIGYFARPRGII